MATILRVKALKPYRVRLWFKGGRAKVVDLERHLHGRMFAPLRKPNMFRKVRVCEGGGIEWPNGADICPDLLYYDGTPPWAKRFLKRQASARNIPRGFLLARLKRKPSPEKIAELFGHGRYEARRMGGKWHVYMPPVGRKPSTYTVVLDYDPHERVYNVSVPALTGCFTWGRTRKSALRNAKLCIEGFIETLRDCGAPVPKNRKLYQIRIG